MTTVTVPVALGGDGAAFSDAGESARDMNGQGYATHFIPLLNQAVDAIALGVEAAASVLTAPGTMATSTTSLTVATGPQSLTIETGKAIAKGQRVVLAYTTDPTIQMTGIVTDYVSGTGALSLQADGKDGAGTYALWTVALQGKPGSSGIVGASAITGATTLGAAHKARAIDLSGTFSLAFAAVDDLGVGWWSYVRNGGSGDVTIDPDGAETCDGVASFVMYPNAARLFYVDETPALRSIALSGGTKTFASTDNYVWAPGVQAWDYDAYGAGAGGGGGARGAARKNGGGGGAGERLRGRVLKSQITVGASTACTVGAKGTGGAAAAGDSTSGSNGTNGGNTTIGALATAYGGSYGVYGHYAANDGAGGRGGSTLQISASTARVSQSGEVSSTAITTTPYDTEWAGPNGRAGDDVTTFGKAAKLGGQWGGRGGAAFAAGAPGGNAVNPGNGGDGGAGNINGSAAGKGGDGADGQITIVEVI